LSTLTQKLRVDGKVENLIFYPIQSVDGLQDISASLYKGDD
jgi:hypothetical protein